MQFVTVAKAAELTGLSERAIRQKIFYRIWREGDEFRRGPDGRVYVDLDGYAEWVQGS